MRKVAIVARAGTSSLAPFRDETWEIWGMPWISYPRLTRAYDIHSAQYYEDVEPGWLKDRFWVDLFNQEQPNCPIYCDPTSMGDFLNPKEYPLDAIAGQQPIFYFENSVCYMIAHAIYELHPGDEIGLWGVHMWVGDEAGLAQGRGITVSVAPGSPLFLSSWAAGRYGLQGTKQGRRKKFVSFAGIENYAAMANRKPT